MKENIIFYFFIIEVLPIFMGGKLVVEGSPFFNFLEKKERYLNTDQVSFIFAITLLASFFLNVNWIEIKFFNDGSQGSI